MHRKAFALFSFTFAVFLFQALPAQAQTKQPPSPPASGPISTGLFRGRPVTFHVIDELAIYEGDIVLGTATQLAAPSGPGIHGIGEAYPSAQWPKAGSVYNVPYITTNGTGNMTAAVNQFNALFAGFIQFMPRVAETDYVDIDLNAADTSGLCFSNVGRIGGAQMIGGSGSCEVSTLIHEMGHTVGLWHVQSRADRDNYITVNYGNVIKSLKDNFDQLMDNSQSLGRYDYGSLMHYFATAFTKNGNPTIESKPSGIPLSNVTGYTENDIDSIRRLYDAAPTSVIITSNPPGLQVIVDGNTITTPQTFPFALNSNHTLNVAAGSQNLSGDNYIFRVWNDGGAQSHSITITPGNGLRANPVTSPQITVYTANFAKLLPFSTQALPANGGTINAMPAAQSYPPAAGLYYIDRTPVTLTATPNGGFNFYGWFGLPYAQGLNPNTTYYPAAPTQAVFTQNPVTTITTNPAGGALGVTVDGGFWYTPKNFANEPAFGLDPTWTAGSMHSVSAAATQAPFSANSRFTFASWSDGMGMTHNITNPATSSTFTATYTPQFFVTSSVEPQCGGTITPADTFYNVGTGATFSAANNTGWTFAGWEGDLMGLTASQFLTVNDEELIQADFNTSNIPNTIRALAPSAVQVNSAGVTLTIRGTGFTNASVVFVNGQFRTPSFVNATTLTVAINASDLTTAGTIPIGVANFPQGAPCSAYAQKPLFIASTAVAPPTADSISPNSGNSSTQMFTATFSDPYEAADLNLGYVLFNTRIDGANACMIAYSAFDNLIYLINDAGDGLVAGSLTPGSPGTLANKQCTVDASAGTVTKTTNTVVVSFSVTFQPFLPGQQNIYMLAVSLNGTTSGWQTRGTFTGASNSAPQAVSATPNSGAGLMQTFSFVYTDTNSNRDFSYVLFVFNSALNGANACFGAYYPSSNQMYLINDAGNGLQPGSVAPGSPGSVGNSQCTIASGGSVTLSGPMPPGPSGITLTLPVAITFNANFTGNRIIYGYAADNGGLNSGWTVLGNWTPAPNRTPTVVSVSPGSGSGASQTFTMTYRDLDGFQDLAVVYVLVNSGLNSANACFVAYNRPVNLLYLVNDAGNGLQTGSITPGNPGMISNSQCTMASGGTVSGAGTDLMVPVSLTFTSGPFSGPKTIFLLAADTGNATSGWQSSGSWTVP